MTTMVRFQASGTAYCLPVEATMAVLRASGMVNLPAPHPDVSGIIPGDPPLTVISPFGTGANTSSSSPPTSRPSGCRWNG